LPLAELIGVAHRSVTEAISGAAKAADRAIDAVEYRLVVDMDGPGMKTVCHALGA
jgi:flavin-binding protein dodecin